MYLRKTMKNMKKTNKNWSADIKEIKYIINICREEIM